MNHPKGSDNCAVCRRYRADLEADPHARELAAQDDPDLDPPEPAPEQQPTDDDGDRVREIHHHHHHHERTEHTTVKRERPRRRDRRDRRGKHRSRQHRKHGGILRNLAVLLVMVWVVHSFYPNLNVPLVPGVACTSAMTSTGQTVDASDTAEPAGFMIPIDPLPSSPFLPWAAPRAGKAGKAVLSWSVDIVKTAALNLAAKTLHTAGDTFRAMLASPPSPANIEAGLRSDFHTLGVITGFVVHAFQGHNVASSAAEGAGYTAAASGCAPCPGVATPVAAAGASPIAVAAAAVRRAGWTGHDAVVALAVAGAESGYRPTARNASSASGLFQMKYPMHRDLFQGGRWDDPYANAAAAHRLWADQGWAQPWVTYRSGAYKAHLAEARAALTVPRFATTAARTPSSGKTTVDGKQLSVIAARQLALAERIGHINLTVIQGGYGGSHFKASGTSHKYSGVADVAPGSIEVETLLRRVGFAAWARNIPGRSSVGSGAHVHAVSLIDPGDAKSPQVYGSWAHHGNGLSGTDNDPAPHYAWVAGLSSAAASSASSIETTCAPMTTQASYSATTGRGFTVASLNVLGASHHKGGPPVARMRSSVRLLGRHRVDLVGFQEMQPGQAATFDRLAGRTFARVGAENSIAWRRDTFALNESHVLRVPYFYGHAKPMPYVRLSYLRGSGQVWVVDVHNASSLTARGNMDRYRRAAVVREQQLVTRLRATGDPVVMVGDMNAHRTFARQARAVGMHAAAGRSYRGIDWIVGSRQVRFVSHVSDRSALDRAATDHPIVVSDVRIRNVGAGIGMAR